MSYSNKDIVIAVGTSLDPVFEHFCIVSSWLGVKLKIFDIPYLETQEGYELEEFSTEIKDCLQQSYPIFFRPKIIKGELESICVEYYNVFYRVFNEKSNYRIINPIENKSSNKCKFIHTSKLNQISSELDIKIPRTILSNNFQDILSFFPSSNTQIINKGNSSVKSKASLLNVGYLEDYNFTYPLLLQEYIAGYEVRVHLVNDLPVAEKICSNEIDYRFSKTNKYSTIQLPSNVINFCKEVNKAEGLTFSGIDFRVNNEKYFFLEANSLPDYRGYDKRANFEITKNLIKYLIE
jgi:hypothetical protein